MKSNSPSWLSIICTGIGMFSFFPYVILWIISRPVLANNIGFFAPITVLLGAVTLFSGIPLGLLGILFGVLAITQKTDQFLLTSLGILFNTLGIVSHIWLFGYIIEFLNTHDVLT